MKNSITTILFLLFCSIAIAQGPPPTMDMPTESNTIIVDKIFKASNYEQYFLEYCKNKVRVYAIEKKWSSEKTKKVLANINLKYFMSNLYSNYAQYSTEELKEILNLMTLINADKSYLSSMILINPMIQNNLDVFLKGCYDEK